MLTRVQNNSLLSIIKRTNTPFWPFIDLLWALMATFWVPTRLVFLTPNSTRDFCVEILLGAGAAFIYFRSYLLKPQWKWPIILATILVVTPWGQIFSTYFILTKLLLITGLWEMRNVLYHYDGLHPVFTRLIPLVPVVVATIHILSCGWVWINNGAIAHSADRFFEYGKSIYWTVTTLTTVGYGDITPKTLPQMFYACLTMILGVGFFGYVLSNVASVLARLDATREEYLTALGHVENYMSYNKVPSSIKRKVRSYYRYLWDSGKGPVDQSALRPLPAKLRAEIALAINAEIIDKVPLFRNARPELLEDVMLELQHQTTVPGEKIFHIDGPGDALYFIQKGQVEIITRSGDCVATLGPGSFFGEAALLNDRPRNATARSTDYGDLYVLEAVGFHKVLTRYPDFEKHVKEIANARENKK